MSRKIYRKGDNVYLTGCTHFGSASIIRTADRPFATLTEMNEVMIENWNRLIKPGDQVFHLGDVENTKSSKSDFKDKLKGDVVYLYGDADYSIKRNCVYRTVIYMDITSHLFHYPIEDWEDKRKGTYHFHCHTHSKIFKSGERRGNVSVDAIDFKPIHISEAIERVRPHV